MPNNRDRFGADFREAKNLVNLPPKPRNIVLISLVMNRLYGRRKTRITTSCIFKNECLQEKDLRLERLTSPNHFLVGDLIRRDNSRQVSLSLTLNLARALALALDWVKARARAGARARRGFGSELFFRAK